MTVKQKIRINFSDFWHPDTLAAKRANPLYRLLATRFDLEICAQRRRHAQQGRGRHDGTSAPGRSGTAMIRAINDPS